MATFDAMMADAQEQNGLSDLEELLIRESQSNCECCGGTGTEEVDVGHGSIMEVPCSLCSERLEVAEQ